MTRPPAAGLSRGFAPDAPSAPSPWASAYNAEIAGILGENSPENMVFLLALNMGVYRKCHEFPNTQGWDSINDLHVLFGDERGLHNSSCHAPRPSIGANHTRKMSLVQNPLIDGSSQLWLVFNHRSIISHLDVYLRMWKGFFKHNAYIHSIFICKYRNSHHLRMCLYCILLLCTKLFIHNTTNMAMGNHGNLVKLKTTGR